MAWFRVLEEKSGFLWTRSLDMKRSYGRSPTKRSFMVNTENVYTFATGRLSMRRDMVGGLVFRKGQSTNVTTLTTRLKGARIDKTQVIGPRSPVSPSISRINGDKG